MLLETGHQTCEKASEGGEIDGAQGAVPRGFGLDWMFAGWVLVFRRGCRRRGGWRRQEDDRRHHHDGDRHGVEKLRRSVECAFDRRNQGVDAIAQSSSSSSRHSGGDGGGEPSVGEKGI